LQTLKYTVTVFMTFYAIQAIWPIIGIGLSVKRLDRTNTML